MAISNSGQKDTSKVIIAEKSFYRGSILIGVGEVASLLIYNCKKLGDGNVDNMVGELSVPAEEGAMAIDPIIGSIDCDKGICAVLVGTAKYHVRGSALPF